MGLVNTPSPSFLPSLSPSVTHACLSMLSNEDDVITNLDDVYDIGTFVEITELHDVGDKIRMIVQGHRRLISDAI